MTDPIAEYKKTMSDDETVRMKANGQHWEGYVVDDPKPTPIDSLLTICLLLAGMFCGGMVVLTVQAVMR